MLRIQTIETDPGRVRLRLDGRLGASEVEILSACVEPFLAEGREVELDLAELRFADGAGARYLAASAGRGVRTTGATGYVHELLRSEEDAR